MAFCKFNAFILRLSFVLNFFFFFLVQVSGDQGNAIWNCEGVQVGALGSSFGVLGSWTTIFHDIDDPVGEKSQILFFSFSFLEICYLLQLRLTSPSLSLSLSL